MTSHEAARPPLEMAGPPGPLSAIIGFLRTRTLILVTVASLALLGVGVGVLLTGDAEEAERPPGTPGEASVADLRALAERATSPIYWAGTAPGSRFELTETRGGKVFVRYLPPGVKVDDKRADFLTVATYPYARAYAVTEKSSQQKGMDRAPAPAGGLAVWNEKRPDSVYVAYPGSDLLVEVFSPDPSEARRLVLDGEVGPVDRGKASPQTAPSLTPLFEQDR